MKSSLEAELPKPPKIQKHIVLPETMRTLQEKFLNEQNIDTFLSTQDEEVLEYFHQNYNKNHLQIRVNVDNNLEEAKSSSNDDNAEA